MPSALTKPRRLGLAWLALLLSLVVGCAGSSSDPTSPPAASPPAPAYADLAPTPPMGWNSWNRFRCGGINETLIRQTADAMVNSGLAAAGYAYLTLDDCWSASTRSASGDLQPDTTKFPGGMKATGDYIHGRGLKYGIYASIGTATCTGKTPGSLGNEARDVRTFASWGVDYIKADRCHADGLDYKAIYARWREAIVASGRPMVLSASVHGRNEPWAWGPGIAHLWRTTSDISDSWTRMLSLFDQNARHPGAAGPGHWNDPDMLEVGNGRMSESEYRVHFALWALAAAPLIAGNDVRGMSEATKAILTHPEVIAIDQDPLGNQGVKVRDSGTGLQVWFKPLQGRGVRAVGLVNRSDAPAEIGVDWSDVGLATDSALVRDVWARADMGSASGGFSTQVPPRDVVLLKITGTDPPMSGGTTALSDLAWIYAANDYGPVERDASNGESRAGDGRTITLGGTPYAKGLGTHAPSVIEYRPNGRCTSLAADVGVDDEAGDRGSVVFQVWADGVKLFDSGVLRGTSPTARVDANLRGRNELRLVALSGEDDTSYDHADWADARITCTP